MRRHLLAALLAAPAYGAGPGYVVKVDGARVYLDLGLSSGAAPGARFIVYEEGPELVHPVTGASLGPEVRERASGTLREAQETYSVGELAGSPERIRPGQRARLQAEAPPPPAPPAKEVPPAAAGAAAQPALPISRTPSVDLEAVDIAVGDVDGDGTPDAVLSGPTSVRAYPTDGRPFSPLCSHQDDATAARNLSVEAADLDSDGRAEVFVTVHNRLLGRVETHVLACKGPSLERTASVPWMVRQFHGEDGSTFLAAQPLLPDASFPLGRLQRLTFSGGRYQLSGEPIRHKRLEWLYGAGLAGGEGGPLLVRYNSANRLEIRYSKRGSWQSREAYGQTANRLRWHERPFQFHPRLLIEARPELATVVTLRNIPRFGALADAFGLYQNAELHRLSWNGQSLEPAWKADLGGYAAGLAVLPERQGKAAELLVAVVSGDGRTSIWSFLK